MTTTPDTPTTDEAGADRRLPLTTREVRERIREVGERHRFHVFIAYSHNPDKRNAILLRRRLHAIGRSWWGRRWMRVFQDISDLPVDPDLRRKIEESLLGSSCLALLASRGSARSPWVGEELAAWFADEGRTPPAIVHTDGYLRWNEQTGDFAWRATGGNALNRELFSRRYPEIPVWASLVPEGRDRRWYRRWWVRRRQLTDAAVSVASAALNIHREVLGPYQRRRQRRGFLATVAAAVGIPVLAATTLWYFGTAREEARHAAVERMVASATTAHTDVSLLLRGSAYLVDPERQGSALWEQAVANPGLRRIPAMPAGGAVGTVSGVAFSPDGRWLAAAVGRFGVPQAPPATVVLWPASGEGRGRAVPVPGLKVAATAVAFSADSRWLGVGDAGGRVALVAVGPTGPDPGPAAVLRPDATGPPGPGTPVQPDDGAGVDRLSFTPDGTRLAASDLRPDGTGTTRIWDLPGRRQVAAFPGTRTRYSPDGATLATLVAERVELRDASTLTVMATLHSGRVPRMSDLAYRADGRAVAVAVDPIDPQAVGSGAREPGVWLGDVPGPDPSAGPTIAELRPVPDTPACLALAYADTDLIVTSAGTAITGAGSPDPSVRHLNVASGRAFAPVVDVGAVAFRPGTAEFALAGGWHGASPRNGAVLLLDPTASGPGGAAPPVQGRGPSALSPDGRSVAMVGGDGAVRRLDAVTGGATGPPLQATGDTPAVLRFSPTGDLLAGVTGRGVTVWNLADGHADRLVLPAAGPPPETAPVGLAFHPDGRRVAVARPDGRVSVLRTGGGLPPARDRDLDTAGSTTDLAFSPDGRTLVAATTAGVHRWETTGWRSGTTLRPPAGPTAVHGVAFAGTGAVAGSAGSRLYTWDLSTGAARLLSNGDPASGPVSAVAVDPRATLLVALRGYATQIEVWDLRTRRRVGPLLPAPVSAASLAFTDGGKRLTVTGTTVMQWNLDPHHWLEWLCNVVQRNLDAREWHAYGYGRRPHTCAAWPLE